MSKKIKHHVICIEQGWSPQCESFPVLDDTEWAVLKVGCVNGGDFQPSQNKKLPDTLTPTPEYVIRKGDILISRANAKEWVGSSAVVTKDYSKLLLCDKLYRLSTKASSNPFYISFFLGTKKARRVIEVDASGTSSSMLNIGQKTIMEMHIPTPPHDEQNELVHFLQNKLRQFSILTEESNNSINLLKEHRTALISAAVTGKIDVRDQA